MMRTATKHPKMRRSHRGRPATKEARPPTGLVAELLDLIEQHKAADPEKAFDLAVELRAGIAQGTLSKWRRGMHDPKLFNFQCAAEAVGFRLALVPIAKDGR